MRSFVSVGRDNNAPIKPHIRFFSMTRRGRCLSVVVVAIPNPWPLKAQFRPSDRSRCASGSRSGDANSAARLYQVTGLIAQSSSTTGECRFWVIFDVPGRAPKWSGVPQQPDAQNVLRLFGIALIADIIC
jgi:hypothetical protein